MALVEAFCRTGGGGVCVAALYIFSESFGNMGFVGKVVKMGVKVDLSMPAGQ